MGVIKKTKQKQKQNKTKNKKQKNKTKQNSAFYARFLDSQGYISSYFALRIF